MEQVLKLLIEKEGTKLELHQLPSGIFTYSILPADGTRVILCEVDGCVYVTHKAKDGKITPSVAPARTELAESLMNVIRTYWFKPHDEFVRYLQTFVDSPSPSNKPSRKGSALDRFIEHGGYEEQDPIERLRFFVSCMEIDGQDWLDIEAFFDDVIQERERLIKNAT